MVSTVDDRVGLPGLSKLASNKYLTLGRRELLQSQFWLPSSLQRFVLASEECFFFLLKVCLVVRTRNESDRMQTVTRK